MQDGMRKMVFLWKI